MHKEPSVITRNDTGDVACDSYHKYEDDVQIIRNIGVRFIVFDILHLPTKFSNIVFNLTVLEQSQSSQSMFKTISIL